MISRDVEAFRDWRLSDLHSHDRVQPTSFDTDRAAINAFNAFYTWAGPRFGVVNPVPTVRAGSPGRPVSRARVKAQRFTPLAAQDLAAERDKLARELADVRQELAHERAATAVLRRIAAELAIELDQARNEMTADSKVTRLPLRGTQN